MATALRYACDVPTLLLGPLLRYVDDTSATVWVETDSPCVVEVLGHTARTFHVAGHYYALVAIRGLQPGSSNPYQVRLDGERVWPEPTGPGKRSTIRTISNDNDAHVRLLFGSCRSGSTADAQRGARFGPDALDAYARSMAGFGERDHPDALMLLGDQVYADETAPAIRRLLAARRDLNRPPGTEVADFEEYTWLYQHVWSDPAVRWLLSTVPTMMIFDDHDVRDDWNTSYAWREQMASRAWWPDRLAGALISYWIYQHIGNLSPDHLEHDETYLDVVHTGRRGDAMPVLRHFAEQADHEYHGSKTARWSFRRDLGPMRLIVVDARGGRIVESERSMLSTKDFQWLRESTASDREHLVIVSSLPWLLPQAVHHLQEWDEAICNSSGRMAAYGEWLRQAGDLEHWASFRSSFDTFSEIIGNAARSYRSSIPDARGGYSSVTVLSGDVHHSYLADYYPPPPHTSRPGSGSTSGNHAPVVQVTCSPIHQTTPRGLSWPLRAAWTRLLTAVFRRFAKAAGVPRTAGSWSKSAGPFFGNMLGTLDLHGPNAEVRLDRAEDLAGNWTRVCRRVLH